MSRLVAVALSALLFAGAAQADMIFDPASGCATSNPFPRPGESVRWSGGCRDGLLDGPGALIWLDDGVEYERDEGVFRGGELHGEALITFAAGGRIQGRYRNGARDGEFVVERPDGTIVRAIYEKGLFISEQPMSAAEAAAWRAGRPLASSAPAVAAAPPPAPVAAAPMPPAPAPVAPPPPAFQPPPAPQALPAFQPPPVSQAPPAFQLSPPAMRLRFAPPPSGKLGAVPLASRTVALVPPASSRSPSPSPSPPPQWAAPPPRLQAPPVAAATPVPTPVTAGPQPTATTAPSAPSSPAAASGRYAVSLQDASIRDAAETVLSGILNRRYVVEPGVAGAVSIAAENFVDSAPLLSAFRRELLRNGADLVDQSGVLRIFATRVTAPPAPTSAIGRRACTRPELYDGGAQWCGVVRGETAEAYDVEVVSVAPNATFASGLAASPCTGGVFLSRFERGKRIAAPKGCLDFEG